MPRPFNHLTHQRQINKCACQINKVKHANLTYKKLIERKRVDFNIHYRRKMYQESKTGVGL